MNPKTKLWLKALIASVVSGAANAASATLGISAANLVGIKIEPLNLQQLGSVSLSGGIIGLIFYLKQSPVPPDDNTTVITKTQTVEIKTPKQDENKTNP